MSKRFTETDKWKDKWFRKLSPHLKLLWIYILDNCDNAGIFETDWELFSFQIGQEINETEAIDAFKDKISLIREDTFIIKKFIEIQWGILNPKNAAHRQVLRCLRDKGLVDFEVDEREVKGKKYSNYLNIDDTNLRSILNSHYYLNNTQACSGPPSGALSGPLSGPKDKDKDKDKDKEKEKEKEKEKVAKIPTQISELFDAYRSIVNHRGTSKQIVDVQRKLKSIMPYHPHADIISAINNYQKALESKKISYRWDLWEFLGHERAEKYYPENFKPGNFKDESKSDLSFLDNLEGGQDAYDTIF